MFKWKDVNARGWSYKEENLKTRYVIFQMDTLPDLSAPRFQYLGERVSDRKNELIKKGFEI